MGYVNGYGESTCGDVVEAYFEGVDSGVLMYDNDTKMVVCDSFLELLNDCGIWFKVKRTLRSVSSEGKNLHHIEVFVDDICKVNGCVNSFRVVNNIIDGNVLCD